MFFGQLDWKQFTNQPHIKKLTLNEQMNQFNFHLQQMSNLNKFQPKGTARRAATSGAVIGTGTGWDFFHDTLLSDGTAAKESGTNIQYAIDTAFYANSVQYGINYNHQPAPGATKPYGFVPDWNSASIDEIRVILKRVSPDNTNLYDATFNIEASAGTLGTVELITTPAKTIPYSISSGTTINGGSAWTWKITGFSNDFRALFTITEKP